MPHALKWSRSCNWISFQRIQFHLVYTKRQTPDSFDISPRQKNSCVQPSYYQFTHLLIFVSMINHQQGIFPSLSRLANLLQNAAAPVPPVLSLLIISNLFFFLFPAFCVVPPLRLSPNSSFHLPSDFIGQHNRCDIKEQSIMRVCWQSSTGRVHWTFRCPIWW